MPEVTVEKHLMLDLETLGTTPNSIILEIGAVAFDPYGPLLGNYDATTKDTFYRTVDVDSCARLGLELDANTLLWWFKQNDLSRHRVVDHPKTGIAASAEALRNFCHQHKVTKVWGHGGGFDPILMANVYTKLRKDTPWKYNDVRDTRTLFGVTDLEEKLWAWLMRRDTLHHPTQDAWAQARAVQYCLTGELDGDCPNITHLALPGPLAA